MAKIYGQLERAQFENTTSDTASLPKGIVTYRTDLNIAKVSNGTALKALIDEDSTQSLAGKTLTTPTITSPAVFTEITTPANPSANQHKEYFKSDGLKYKLNSAGTEEVFAYKSYVDTPQTIYSAGNTGAALAIDWTNGDVQTCTVTANVTFTFSNPVAGRTYMLIMTQDATGGRTYTWPVAVKWSQDDAAPSAGTANLIDVVTFFYTGSVYLGNYSLKYT